ncbi:hypothetical protein [Streptomyces sp. NPDC047071]|uniref:hypothetical protein n=1 Tax=Streptomyces sp. NPDC047071 TaxID=3154808 RepID=UPI0034553338
MLTGWPDIAAAVAPQLPDHVAAVVCHAETGQRWLNARIVAVVNESVRTDAVNTVQVRLPAPV